LYIKGIYSNSFASDKLELSELSEGFVTLHIPDV